MLHHSPTRSRLRAIGQCIFWKLFRRMAADIGLVTCIMQVTRRKGSHAAGRAAQRATRRSNQGRLTGGGAPGLSSAPATHDIKARNTYVRPRGAIVPARPPRRFRAPRAGALPRRRAGAACRRLDRAAGAALLQSPARSRGRPRARARMAARLLEAAAAAVVARLRRGRAHRHARRALSARAARVGDRDLGGVAARARGRRPRHGADCRARARRHSLLQFLRREVQSRRPAASVVDARGAVLLSRADG